MATTLEKIGGVILKWTLATIITAVILALMGLLMALPTMLLWDYVMPALFGLPEITYLQAVALFWLCGALVRGRGLGDQKKDKKDKKDTKVE